MAKNASSENEEQREKLPHGFMRDPGGWIRSHRSWFLILIVVALVVVLLPVLIALMR